MAEGIIAEPATARDARSSSNTARRGDRGTVDLDAVVGERVLHRVGHRGGGRDDAALAHALDAEGVDRGGEVHVDDLERRHLVGARQGIVHQRAGEELPRVVVDQRLAQRAAEALGDAAVELAFHDHRVDGPPAVVHGGQLEQPDAARFQIHLGDDALHAEGPRDGVGIEEGAGAEPGAARLGHRAAPHRGAGHLAQAHALAGHALDVHAALGEHDVLGRALEELGARPGAPCARPARRCAAPRGRSPRPRGSRSCPCRSRPGWCRRPPPPPTRAAPPARRPRSGPAWSRAPGPARRRPGARTRCRPDPRGCRRPRRARCRCPPRRRRARARWAARSRAASPARPASPCSRAPGGAARRRPGNRPGRR